MDFVAKVRTETNILEKKSSLNKDRSGKCQKGPYPWLIIKGILFGRMVDCILFAYEIQFCMIVKQKY